MTIEDQIFKIVGEVIIPKYFVTVELQVTAKSVPEDIETFLYEKYEAILNGASGRKFIYQKGEWRLIFTFFPTDRIVDERYALKNKIQIRSRK